ncbi:MAG: hypothetical protein V4755_16900, partial [Curtobacterium sp.]
GGAGPGAGPGARTPAGRLAFTGVQDLGLAAAVSGVLAAAGAAAWWAVRRRRHGAVDDTGEAVSDVVRR